MNPNAANDFESEPVVEASHKPRSRRTLQLLLLIAATTAGSYARVAVGPLQEAIRVALGLNDNEIALVQGPALALLIVMGAMPLGVVIDRYSRVRILFMFALCNAAGSVFTALSSGLATLFVARCIVGMTAIGGGIAAISLLSDIYEPAQRGRATMAIAIGQAGGAAAAFALGGKLLTVYASESDGWRMAMLWLAALVVPVAFALLAMREPQRAGIVVKNRSVRGALVELWSYRDMIAPLVGGVVLVEIAVGAPLTWAAPMFARNFRLQPDRIGVILGTVMIVSGVVGPMGGGLIADICERTGGTRRTIVALSGLALLGIPAGCFSMLPSVAAASVSLVAFIAIASACCVIGQTLFTIVVPNELRGLCIGALTTSTVLFSVGISPMIVSMLSSALGGPSMLGRSLSAVCVTTSLMGALMFSIARRHLPRARA
jgi:MFS family permease